MLRPILSNVTTRIDTAEKAQAVYAKEITKLHETLDGPTGDFPELQLAEIRSRLSGLKPIERYAAVIRAIAKNNDAVIAAVTKTNEFLVDFLTDGERSEILRKWRAARFPEQFARFQLLESDVAHIERAGRILESYQQLVANQAIVAGGIIPPTTTRAARRGRRQSIAVRTR
jgi:hypothetical protein